MSIDIEMIKSQWGFNEVIIEKEFEVKGNRIVNLLNSDKGKFILKGFCQTKDESDIKRDTFVIKSFEGVKTKLAPKLLNNKFGELYSKVDDRYVYLLEYIDGREMKEVPEEEFMLGAALANLHDIKEYSVVSGINTEKRKSAMLKRFHSYDFKKEYDDIIRSLPDFSKHKQAFIHTDVTPQNALLTSQGEVIFIDLDDAGLGSIYIDAGYPLITQFIRFQEDDTLKIDRSNAEAFYNGYFSNSDNALEEREMFFWGAVFMQLMYMPCYGEEAVKYMWMILDFAMKNKEELLKILHC